MIRGESDTEYQPPATATKDARPTTTACGSISSLCQPGGFLCDLLLVRRLTLF